MDLDEIHSLSLQLVDRLSRLLRCAYCEPIRCAFFRPIDKRPSADNVGTDTRTTGDLRPPTIDLSEVSTHVTDARDAIHDQERESVFRGIREVPMHVPKSGYHEFAGAINYASAGRY